MAAKLKVDQLETVDGTGNVTLNNSVTMAAGKTIPAASLTGSLPAGMGGKVLQVVQATSTTGVTVSSSSYTSIGASAAITPTSTSNKVLVINCTGSMAYNAGDIAMRIVRDSTEIMVQGRQAYTNANEWVGNPVTLIYLDSPSSTSSITYSFECKVSGNQIEYNSAGGGTTNVNSAVTLLMEIAG